MLKHSSQARSVSGFGVVTPPSRRLRNQTCDGCWPVCPLGIEYLLDVASWGVLVAVVVSDMVCASRCLDADSREDFKWSTLSDPVQSPASSLKALIHWIENWSRTMPCCHERWKQVCVAGMPIPILYIRKPFGHLIWVVVKIMVPFWIHIIIRHLLFRVPKKGP